MHLSNATSKEVKVALKSANMALGTSKYIAGDTLTLADVCLWAGIHATKASNLPSNIKVIPGLESLDWHEKPLF